MFLQIFTLRLMVMVAMLMTGITGLVYTAAPMSDSPLFLAYVDQFTSSSNSLYAYLIDPVRRYTIPIELPVPRSLVNNFDSISRNEPDILYLNYTDTDRSSDITFGRVYRYNVYSRELTTVYETMHGSYLPGFSTEIISFNRFSDDQYFIVADKIGHAVVLVDKKTLEQRVLWQGETIQRLTNYTFQVFRSPKGDKFAILDESNDATLIIVSAEGEILNDFPVIDQVDTSVSWLPDNQQVMVGAMFSQSERDIRVYDSITGDINPYTETLQGANVGNLYPCQDAGQWISYTQEIEEDVYQLFTMNLRTGAAYAHATAEAKSGTFGTLYMSILANSDCSMLLQTIFKSTTALSDVYRTTLKGENLELLLSDVILGSFTDNSLIYGQESNNHGYNLYEMSFEDVVSSELLLSDLPTRDAVWRSTVLEHGWYIIHEDSWSRRESEFAFIDGDPLLRYDVHSGKAYVLTPPDVPIMFTIEVP